MLVKTALCRLAGIPDVTLSVAQIVDSVDSEHNLTAAESTAT